MLNQTRVTATETNGPEIQKSVGLGKRTHRRKQARQSMFCGEEELGRTCPFFSLGAGSVSVCLSQGSKSRGGPKYGTAQAQTHGTVRTKVQCPIPPVELQTRVPFSSLFSVSVSTSTSHPSSSPPTNQPPFPPSPLIPSRRHCDLLKLDPTRATTRGEGSRPDMEEWVQERCGM